MKNTYINFLLIACLIISGNVNGQTQNQEFKVPLSDPGSPGVLSVRLHRGSVKVMGYSGEDVIVTVVPYMDDDDDDDERTREGLRRIPNTATQFTIEEVDNQVNLSGSNNKRTDFEVQVPREFSLKLKTHHDGYIEIKDVDGEIEADGHHDDIVMESVAGSVIADTHHGEIRISFTSVDSNAPMAFSTYHGDIDVTFPGNINASAKVKSSRGEIYSDFDLDLKVETKKVPASGKGTKIELIGWMRGDIGSGGPEILFNTYHGDVILRMK